MTENIIDSSLQEAFAAGTSLPLMEDFYTIQGEGFFTGQAAYFIRLAGCDVGCHWCDVKESWDSQGHPVLEVSEIVARASAHLGRLVVITGGEPLMHNLGPLTSVLKNEGFHINIETSGSSPLSGQLDWVCLSPKKFKAPVDEAWLRADELKIIVYNTSDLAWAEAQASRVRPDCILYLQPEWGRREKMMPEIVEYIKNNPRWRTSLQTHKYMNIP